MFGKFKPVLCNKRRASSHQKKPGSHGIALGHLTAQHKHDTFFNTTLAEAIMEKVTKIGFILEAAVAAGRTVEAQGGIGSLKMRHGLHNLAWRGLIGRISLTGVIFGL